MAQPGTPSPAARFVFGLVCILCGLFPALAAFDVGPLGRADINGPPWLGLLAGGIFIAGGIALMLGERMRDSMLGAGLFALIIGSFACIANWIAFGAGPRACTIAFAGLFFAADSLANEIACRAGFGIGAGLLDGFVLRMIAGAVRTLIGPGLLPTAIEKAGAALIMVALAPILLPMLLFALAKSFAEGFATWRRTGRWPRNEPFIQRMKARRAQKP